MVGSADNTHGIIVGMIVTNMLSSVPGLLMCQESGIERYSSQSTCSAVEVFEFSFAFSFSFVFAFVFVVYVIVFAFTFEFVFCFA